MREWHRKQNRKSVKVRRAKSKEKANAVYDFITEHAGISNRKAAEALGIAESTVRWLLKKRAENAAQFTVSGAGGRYRGCAIYYIRFIAGEAVICNGVFP
ncbi:MAG: winged helix-turn-helix domain-containing protein [Spirochaetaceae bacterium]|nr:winged helix-turn-helix domain-containing protein [Spirochaetaceae bacterium]